MKRAQGTYTALVTPFDNGKLDLASLEKIVADQLDAKVDGLVPCGTTGESPSLSPDEYEQVVRTVVKARDAAKASTLVYAGAGTNATQKTIDLAKKMEGAGADGLLIVAPYYNKPPQRGLFEHFKAVANAVSVPIMLYNIPGRCGIEVSVETIRQLRESCDNLTSVKHATGKVEGVSQVLDACNIDVLSGDDPLTLAMMSVGAIGVVSVLSNFAPRTVKKMTDAANAGDWTAAREANRKLWPLATVLLGLDTNPIPIKTAMSMRGFCKEEYRLPLVPAREADRETLAKLIRENDIR